MEHSRILLNSPAWHAVLRHGFRCQMLYAFDPKQRAGFAITVFGAGPFRVGYLGFPTGSFLGDSVSLPDVRTHLTHTPLPLAVHCLNVPVSGFAEDHPQPCPYQSAYETMIPHLQTWPDPGLLKVRRARNRLKREAVGIVEATHMLHADRIYTLYRHTVLAHHGQLRYSQAYFRALVTLAQTLPSLKVYLAVFEQEIIGFLVCAYHGPSAYYLHGGTDYAYREHYPSDLLFYHAIHQAREAGLVSYNMQGSPKHQPTLVDYKEKWGGMTCETRVYTLAIQPLPALAFKLARGAYGCISWMKERLA